VLSQNSFKTLNEVTASILHPPEYPRAFSESGFQLIRSQNVRPLGINLDENPVFFSAEFLKNKKVVFAQKGDVLIVRSGVNAGDVAVVQEDFERVIIGADTLLCKCKSNVVPKFLQVYFHTDFGKRQILRHTTGATNKHLNSENLKKVLVPNLSLETQNKAIELFEEGLNAKRIREAEAKNLLDDVDAYLLERLGIEQPASINSKKTFFTRASILSDGRFDPNFIHLSQVLREQFQRSTYGFVSFGKCIDYIQYGISALASTEQKGFPIIRMVNLKGDEWDFSNLKYIELSEKDLETYKVLDGDLLFNRTNSKELVGKCGVFREKGEWVFASYLIRVRVDEDLLLPDFASFFLGSSVGRMQIDCLSRQIIGMTNINTEEIKLIKIPVPPLDAQEEIVTHIQSIRARAKELERDAQAEVGRAKAIVERMILGEVSADA
jgi:restriction endonuclease S subunit